MKRMYNHILEGRKANRRSHQARLLCTVCMLNVYVCFAWQVLPCAKLQPTYNVSSCRLSVKALLHKRMALYHLAARTCHAFHTYNRIKYGIFDYFRMSNMEWINGRALKFSLLGCHLAHITGEEEAGKCCAKWNYGRGICQCLRQMNATVCLYTGALMQCNSGNSIITTYKIGDGSFPTTVYKIIISAAY